jgi:hypothetical protein
MCNTEMLHASNKTHIFCVLKNLPKPFQLHNLHIYHMLNCWRSHFEPQLSTWSFLLQWCLLGGSAVWRRVSIQRFRNCLCLFHQGLIWVTWPQADPERELSTLSAGTAPLSLWVQIQCVAMSLFISIPEAAGRNSHCESSKPFIPYIFLIFLNNM